MALVLESECFHGVGDFEVHLSKVSALPSSRNAGLRAGRSKALSPVCLFRFSELQPLFPITTQPLGEREKGRGYFKYFLIRFGDFFIVFTNNADSDMGLCV